MQKKNDRITMTMEDYQKEQDSLPDMSITGPSTLRVEEHAALLLFQQVSLDITSGIRNYGTFFVGETVLPECLESNPESEGVCRLPSLNSAGYLLAARPISVMWLQLAQPFTPTPPRQLWKGIFEYDSALPDSDKSVLTVWGQVAVQKIAPGFTLSFKRFAFPPRYAHNEDATPMKATINVLMAKDSADLIIHNDIFDTDGLIDCCAENYETSVAELEVMGVNLKLKRYNSFFKDVGDLSDNISEQIVIRAPRIILDEMFLDMEEFIKDNDAVVTNQELPMKLAGMNRDILYFQCFIACQITNQAFLRENPYRMVQVVRSMPKDRHAQGHGRKLSEDIHTHTQDWSNVGKYIHATHNNQFYPDRFVAAV